MAPFKASTRRQVVVTASRMQEGSLPTREALLEHKALRGQAVLADPTGPGSPLGSECVSGSVLEASEQAAVLAVPEALTDEELLRDPRHAGSC